MHQHDNQDLLPRASSWSRGVTVSTLDSESSDRGSNPRETLHDAAVALHLVQQSPCGCSHCPTGGGHGKPACGKSCVSMPQRCLPAFRVGAGSSHQTLHEPAVALHLAQVARACSFPADLPCGCFRVARAAPQGSSAACSASGQFPAAARPDAPARQQRLVASDIQLVSWCNGQHSGL